MSELLVRKIAVLCKRYYVIQSIDDLFIFGGASLDWNQVYEEHTSSRTNAVYGWVEGIKANAPENLSNILGEVANLIIDNEQIPESDKKFLEQQLEKSGQTKRVQRENLEISLQVEELLETLIHGIPRAIQPLKNRRKNAHFLEFDNEYDLQTLFHALMAPWINDIRPEEYTPSYAGASARIDFVLPEYEVVIETKIVRDQSHAKRLGDELIIDIDRYRSHPICKHLWIIIYDPKQFVSNPKGFVSDLKGESQNIKGSVYVRPFIVY